MSVLLLNGSPHPKGCTYTALSVVAAQLEKNGIETQMLQLGVKPIQCCIACGKCKDTGTACSTPTTSMRPSTCCAPPTALWWARRCVYAGPNGGVCSFLDRMFFANPALMPSSPPPPVVSCRRGGASALLTA